MPSIVLVLRLIAFSVASETRAPATQIDWSDFFSRVTATGVEYSDRLKSLEGKRVRLRGYSIPSPQIPGGLLLSRDAFASSDAEETEIPFDVVGVTWRTGISLPPVPVRPTVEGTLRLGNTPMGDQIVCVALADATPVFPAKAKKARARGR